jgi:methionine-S-sulfoxide reductase
MSLSTDSGTAIEKITLGGGCFWCLEAIFVELAGVLSVDSGYSGGTTADPSYDEVCSGKTGHAEVVEISFDPSKLPLPELLRVFFAIHDPTTRNRQGSDVGPQYRSIILVRSDEQRRVAEEIRDETDRQRKWGAPVVTEIVPFERFWRAEGHHQQFYSSNPWQPYCRLVIEPKVEELRKSFEARLAQKKREG